MTFKFSPQSLAKLHMVHPSLQRVVSTALVDGGMDFTVVQGARTVEQQAALYAQGRTLPGKVVTWTMESRHLIQADGYGHAVDLSPYPIDWTDTARFLELVKIMKAAAVKEGVKIIYGADWAKPKQDIDHFELA